VAAQLMNFRVVLSSVELIINIIISMVQYRRDFYCVRLEVFTAVTMKNGVFWDVTPCGSYKNLVFLRSVRRLLVTARVVPSSTIFHPDEGGAKFLRNVGFYKSHTA
jgi:hypothetical protein